jgi:predicted nuclease with TOPRIM domain
MQDVIEEIRDKLDRIDRERTDLEEKLELKRYQLEKIDSMIEKIEELQEEEADAVT